MLQGEPVMKYKIFPLAVFLSIFLSGVFCVSTEAGETRTGKPAVTAPKKAETTTKDPEKPCGRNLLRFGVHVSDMGEFDPHFAAGSQDRAMADMVFNGLLRYSPGNAPKIEADLAESIPKPEIAHGKQVWTFKLRKGVMFHPGPNTKAYELSAEDVVYSLRKSADPARSAYAGEYTGMTFEKVDDYTVRIILEKPLSSVLFLPKISDYAGGFIVSKKAIEAMGYEAFKAHPVGTGPFMFESYKPGKKLSLKANKQYFRGRPFLEGVELHFIPDIKKREAGLKAGDLDVIMGTGERGWIEKIEQERGIVLDIHGVGEVATIHLNTSAKPLNDFRVRKAIAYALNREVFLSSTSKRMVENVYSPVPVQFLPGGLKKEEVEFFGLDYAADLKKAGQLLAEAGYPDGFSLEVVASEKRIYRKNYEIMRDQLAQIGIKCNIKVVPHSSMHRLIRQGVNPIVIYFAWRPNADVYLTRFFHSESIVVTGAKPDTNFSHYNRIDKLIEAARLEIYPHKQINLWMQAQIRILNDAAAYPLFCVNQCYARRSYVDYGHKLIAAMALYPQITEKTRLVIGQLQMTK